MTIIWESVAAYSMCAYAGMFACIYDCFICC